MRVDVPSTLFVAVFRSLMWLFFFFPRGNQPILFLTLTRLAPCVHPFGSGDALRCTFGDPKRAENIIVCLPNALASEL